MICNMHSGFSTLLNAALLGYILNALYQIIRIRTQTDRELCVEALCRLVNKINWVGVS